MRIKGVAERDQLVARLLAQFNDDDDCLVSDLLESAYRAGAEAKLEDIRNDPATQVFGMSIDEVQRAIHLMRAGAESQRDEGWIAGAEAVLAQLSDDLAANIRAELKGKLASKEKHSNG